MARSMATTTELSTAPFGSDLHSFLEQYERAYPEEVIHVEEPLRAEWEITALAMKLEKAQTSTYAAFPRRCITIWIRDVISRKVTF